MTQLPPQQPPIQPGTLGGGLRPDRGGLILALGILSIVIGGCGIGLILGLFAYSMGKTDIAQMDAGVMNPAGRGTTQAGYICGIIGSILGGLSLLAICLYFAFVVMVVGAAGAAGAAGGHGPGAVPFILSIAC